MKQQNWKPATGHIQTAWADDIDPANVLPDYPRPQLVRKEWMNLNGLWDYAIQPKDQPVPSRYQGQILVPFCLESSLSGVKRKLFPSQRLWYHRTFTIPAKWKNSSIVLHFGAVDWEAKVYLNQKLVGQHTGGFYPFSFDISGFLKEGDNELIVSVWDPTDSHWQERGKQVLSPKGIMYTAVSGIWQTVWLEPVHPVHIEQVKITPDFDNSRVMLKLSLTGDEECQAIVSVLEQGKEVKTEKGSSADPFLIELPNPRIWSPESPFLYDLTIKLTKGRKVYDQVNSYFGIRKFGIDFDSSNIPRLYLNNQPLFHNGILDQGYWPDGLYTAPTDEALKFDIELAKKLGFNTLRKHIKIEPARWYYHCDRLGMIVWQDMINGGTAINPFAAGVLPFLGVHLNDNRLLGRFGRNSIASRINFRKEIKEMIDCLYNFPCIGVWVPFNESWGQFNAKQTADWVKEQDPTRIVDHASGWHDQGGGDLVNLHTYFKQLKLPKRKDERVMVISEFGGYSLSIPGHVWNKEIVFGYKKFETLEAFANAFRKLIHAQVKPLIAEGLSAIIYTQLTDVEVETNGLITYDRDILKIKEEIIRQVNQDLQREINKVLEIKSSE
ncbi:beta-galactosidase [bacterium]|nr:beta-galactosidase [bacterium]